MSELEELFESEVGGAENPCRLAAPTVLGRPVLVEMPVERGPGEIIRPDIEIDFRF